jgi:signal transduction histidine kinase
MQEETQGHSAFDTRLADPVAHEAAIRASERQRIARDMHDELSETLTALRFELAALRQDLRKRGLELEAVHRVELLVDQASSAKRRTLQGLTCPLRDGTPLHAAAQELCHRFAQKSGLVVHCCIRPVVVSGCVGQVSYRALQELLSNVGQHAQATRVVVSLQQTNDELRLWVQDDGCGFDPSHVPSHLMGLQGLRERVHALHGQVNIETCLGRGAAVSVILPAPVQMPGPPFNV